MDVVKKSDMLKVVGMGMGERKENETTMVDQLCYNTT